MSINPSLTTRLRIGFAVLFTLLLAVSLLGVGRLFQIRVDYEDENSQLYQLQLETERMVSAFVLEQVSLGSPGQRSNRAQFARAAQSFRTSAGRAGDQAEGDAQLSSQLQRWVASEARWRRRVARPVFRGNRPPATAERSLTQATIASGERLSEGARDARDDAQQNARDDTRDTTILVAAGLVGALLAALLLFSGLINSMRAPLARLVDAARRLEGGDLETRVEVGGPVEIATLGGAFNEMATALERDARERDRIERMKDDFVLTVSHELRTPVTVVKGFAEMLHGQSQALNERQAEAAEVIAESAGQLQNMINDLLDLARSDAGKLRIDPEPTPVGELVQKVGRQMKPHFEERDQEFTVRVDEELPQVMADPHRISQVLSNLLTNANKYANKGAKVELSAVNAGNEIEFAVSDNGPGLDPEQLDHIFDRFWRAGSGETQAVGGTGLGLAIAKSLVELHGGAIAAASTPGQGASFRFFLPIAEERRPARRARDDQAASRAAAGTRS
jgi:signal transduction histidine kinase